MTEETPDEARLRMLADDAFAKWPDVEYKSPHARNECNEPAGRVREEVCRISARKRQGRVCHGGACDKAVGRRNRARVLPS